MDARALPRSYSDAVTEPVAVEREQWERFLAAGMFVVALGFGLGALVQRHELLHPGHDHLFAGIAILPWIVGLPQIPLPGIVLTSVGVLGLVWHPVGNDVAPFLLVLMSGGQAAAWGKWWGLVATAMSSVVLMTVQVTGHYNGVSVWLVAFAIAFFAGASYSELVNANISLQAAQAELAEKAATDERRRIAREVHDVIAHSLAVTMLHITGARLALQRGDPAEAEAGLTEAERLGRQSLADVRRTVGLLASGEGDATAAPEPSAVDIASLIGDYRDAGLDVALSGDGDAARVSAATGLGLYRIAQESLANAARHASGTRVDVSLRVNGSVAALTIRNGPPPVASVPSPDGRGLDGIRERAAQLGGTAQAGPTPDGGWLVDVEVPA